MGQTRLSSTAIIYIERSYANRILQVLMDRIIDVFGKRKNCESFIGSVHVPIILLYSGLRRLLQRSFEPILHLSYLDVKGDGQKIFFKNLCDMLFIYKVLSDRLNCFNQTI